jgi:RecJ-like exonuclease
MSKFDPGGKCLTCKGTGKIPLFTSLADCDVCEGCGYKRELTCKQKQKLISEYIKTPEGRRKLAASMTHPVRRCSPIGRKTFSKASIAA